MRVGAEEGVPLAGTLARTRAQLKSKLSPRARGVLCRLVSEYYSAKFHHPNLDLSKLSEVELLRRASKVEPPITHESLLRRTRGCGKVVARQVCEALGLPVGNPNGAAQCPRCGHVFGGGK